MGPALGACISLVAPYDATFDESLNGALRRHRQVPRLRLGRRTGGARQSKETVEYYAASYNRLDRLSQRASLTRSRACAGNDALQEFSKSPSTTSELPADYAQFDCLEASLYFVRFYLDQLHFDHQSGGVLNRSEAKASGGILQTLIAGAIQTFLAAKE